MIEYGAIRVRWDESWCMHVYVKERRVLTPSEISSSSLELAPATVILVPSSRLIAVDATNTSPMRSGSVCVPSRLVPSLSRVQN